MKIEYRVIPVTRYFVSRFHEDDEGGAGHETKGEYENKQTAHEVGYALCKAEHSNLGWPLGDKRISYPDAPRIAAQTVESQLLA